MKMKSNFLAVCMLALSCVAMQAQDNVTQSTIVGVLTGNQAQVIQLAEAFSEEQYNWRPSEGVNSVGEALLHIAGGNYYLTSKMGFAPPEGVDMMGLGKITGKDNIIAALKKSNAHALENLLAIMEHNGEHKGQLIAYARTNDVVPPWSLKEESKE